jgi:hypothetical protein
MIRREISLFKLALLLELEPTFLSRCINGKEKMPETMGEKLSGFFTIPREILFGDEKKYFKYMLRQLEKGSQ